MFAKTSLGRLKRIKMGEYLKIVKDLFAPITTSPPSCIVVLEITTSHFELKPHIINLLPNFHDLEREDLYMHNKVFLSICLTFKFQNFMEDSV